MLFQISNFLIQISNFFFQIIYRNFFFQIIYSNLFKYNKLIIKTFALKSSSKEQTIKSKFTACKYIFFPFITKLKFNRSLRCLYVGRISDYRIQPHRLILEWQAHTVFNKLFLLKLDKSLCHLTHYQNKKCLNNKYTQIFAWTQTSFCKQTRIPSKWRGPHS